MYITVCGIGKEVLCINNLYSELNGIHKTYYIAISTSDSKYKDIADIVIDSTKDIANVLNNILTKTESNNTDKYVINSDYDKVYIFAGNYTLKTTLKLVGLIERNLTDITIPKGVTILGSFAFAGCDKLICINIPNNITTIGRNAFNYCRSLTSITIPDEGKVLINGSNYGTVVDVFENEVENWKEVEETKIGINEEVEENGNY